MMQVWFVAECVRKVAQEQVLQAFLIGRRDGDGFLSSHCGEFQYVWVREKTNIATVRPTGWRSRIETNANDDEIIFGVNCDIPLHTMSLAYEYIRQFVEPFVLETP